MDVTILCHSGLGDNIAMIGAINYLLEIYNNIYFICKESHLNNLRIIYSNPRIFLIPFKPENEYYARFDILILRYNIKNMDILISGSYHKKNFRSKIKNPKMFNIVKNNDYHINNRFSFIKEFYEDINLDLYIFYNYFKINSTDVSISLYNDIKKYNIIFLHSQTSNCQIDLIEYINKYIVLDDHIIICPNKNIYTKNNSKYKLSELYINLLVPYYIDIIYNSKYIYVVDSCFSTIILPLIHKKINPVECKIFHRDDGSIILNKD